MTSVDLEESHASRPGSPNIGQKQGKVRINDRFNLSEQAKEMAAKETVMGRDHKDTARAKIVTEMSRNFFNTRVKEKPLSEVVLDAVPANKVFAAPAYNDDAEAEPASETGSNLSIEA